MMVAPCNDHRDLCALQWRRTMMSPFPPQSSPECAMMPCIIGFDPQYNERMRIITFKECIWLALHAS